MMKNAIILQQTICLLIKWRNITNNGDDYCINWLHSLRAEKHFKAHQNVCQNHNYILYCYKDMPEKNKNTLKYNHIKNFPLFTLTQRSSLEIIDTYHRNPKRLSIEKVCKTYSLWLFIIHALLCWYHTKNQSYYRKDNSLEVKT